jgi:hypothetical protein
VKLAIADALDRDNVSAAIDQVIASVEDLPLTVLVNNIGGINGIVKPQFKSFENHTVQEIVDTIDLNSRFSMQLTKCLISSLEEERAEPGYQHRLHGRKLEDAISRRLFGRQSWVDGLERESGRGDAPREQEDRDPVHSCWEHVDSGTAWHSDELHDSNC